MTERWLHLNTDLNDLGLSTCDDDVDDVIDKHRPAAAAKAIGNDAKKCKHPTVLILGKTGTGKIDIVKHVFKKSADNFFGADAPQETGLDAATRKPSLDLHHSVHLFSDDDHEKPVMVIAMDTNPSSSPQALFQKLDMITDRINAIFFVMMHGRVTTEDYKPLNDIIKEFKRLTPDIIDCCYLVINGCEGHTEASRKEIIATYKEDPFTRDICESVTEIIPVGFPDLTLIDPELHQYYQKTIEKDEASLEQIVKKSLHAPCLIDIDKKNNCILF
uniref:AIG1-type G domain-containing protein n=1 Tax=Amphimedon queenslandica TaxID=400682 RepID=A0A1X7SNZ7_AMPQE